MILNQDNFSQLNLEVIKDLIYLNQNNRKTQIRELSKVLNLSIQCTHLMSKNTTC